MPSPARSAALALAALSLGCASPRLAGGRSPLDLPGAPARCRIGSGRPEVTVTEWAASEKANLEAQLSSGAVAVEYTGCALRVVTECRLPGGYGWRRTTPATEVIELEGEDDLWAKLPLGAASLSADLKRSGHLTVKTVVSGQARLGGFSAAEAPADPACARATHVVSAIAVGAFRLEGSAKAGGGLEASAASAGAGLRSDRSAGLIRSAGDVEACGRSTDRAPDADCASPIQLFLAPLPGRAAEAGPPGTVRVDLVSADASSRWDVYADDVVVCTTPCSRWLDPSRPLMLRARDDTFGRPDRVQVRDLHPYADDGAVQLVAHPTSRGQLATGITFTAFGGMAVASGAALAGVGCGSSERASFCTGGVTTLAAGAVLTAGALWLILDALPAAELVPGGAPSPRGFSLRLGPGSVSGSF